MKTIIIMIIMKRICIALVGDKMKQLKNIKNAELLMKMNKY